MQRGQRRRKSRGHGNERLSIRHHAHTKRRGHAGIHDQRGHPSIKEGHAAAETATQVKVFAAVVRIAHGQFGEAERAGQRDTAMPRQTAPSSAGEPSDRAIPAGVRKMPSEMASPVTTAVAAHTPICRAACGSPASFGHGTEGLRWTHPPLGGVCGEELGCGESGSGLRPESRSRKRDARALEENYWGGGWVEEEEELAGADCAGDGWSVGGGAMSVTWMLA